METDFHPSKFLRSLQSGGSLSEIVAYFGFLSQKANVNFATVEFVLFFL